MPREGSCTTAKQPSIAAVGPFIISRTEHASYTTLLPHSHPHATITIVLGGGYHETIGGVTHELQSMSVVVKPAGTLHANHVDRRGARCLLLELTADAAECVRTVTNVFDTPRVAPLVRGAELALRTLVVLEKGGNEPASLALESLTMELTAIIAGETCSRNRGQAPPSVTSPKKQAATRFISPECSAGHTAKASVATRGGPGSRGPLARSRQRIARH